MAKLVLRENLPEGEYIAFARGSIHRDDDGRATLGERKHWTDGKETDQTEPVVRFSFEVLWPDEFRGEEASASAPWLNKDGKEYIKLSAAPDGETIISINKKGTMTPNIIRWPEEMGMDWEKDLLPNLPDVETIMDNDVMEAIDRAILSKAKDGRLVVIQTNDKGWVDARESGSVIAIPLHMSEHVKDLKPGIDYEVPWPYDDKPTRQQLETPDELSADNKDSMRDYLRKVMCPALCEGEKPLGLETATEKGYTEEDTGESGHLVAQKIAALANNEGYDCFAVDLMATTLSLVTGAPVQRKQMLDTLSGPQLEAAVEQLPIVLEMLNGTEIEEWQETPEPPPFDNEMPF